MYIPIPLLLTIATAALAYYLIGVAVMMTFGIVFALDQRAYPKIYKRRLMRALTKPFLFAPLWPLALHEEWQEFKRALNRNKPAAKLTSHRNPQN